MKEFYKSIYGTFSDERYARIGEALAVDENLPYRKLSRGMQKQVAFRIALSLLPKVLILDEPLDGLDPVMRRQVVSLIMEDVAETGLTVLISSHNLRELEDVCDTVGIMNKGRMMLERNLS
ncbi:MAG: AAA family ATPase, partial [Oscillospiraceae bacterium]|nr:AAA family ATPase [Oscillospiraceae bacterium]